MTALKPFKAVITLYATLIGIIKTILAMDLLQMFAEDRFMCKDHFTIVAAVWLVPAVQVQVILQRALLCKSLSADLALKRLDAGMDTHVAVQVPLLRESLPTEEAHEKLVHLQVVGVVLQLAENAGAFWTLVVPLKAFIRDS